MAMSNNNPPFVVGPTPPSVLQMRTCSLCKACFSTKGMSYRKASKETIGMYDYILKEIGHSVDSLEYVCRKCIGLLSKRAKVDEKYHDRHAILDTIRNNITEVNDPVLSHPSTPSKSVPVAAMQQKTPDRSSTKRPLTKTPTPRKAYKKRNLSSTPAKKMLFRPLAPAPRFKDASSQSEHLVKDESTSTASLSIPYMDASTQTTREKAVEFAKVTVRTKAGLRVHHVNEPSYVNLCKALAHSYPPRSIAKILYGNEALQEHIDALVCKKLEQECAKLSSKKSESTLLKKDADSMHNVDTSVVLKEWEVQSPLFLKVLKAAVLKVREPNSKDLARIFSVGSLCLFNRNSQMSLLQTAIGLVLDDGGATNEIISLCNSYGFSVSPNTVYRRRKLLMNKNENDKDTHFFQQKRKVELHTAAKQILEKDTFNTTSLKNSSPSFSQDAVSSSDSMPFLEKHDFLSKMSHEEKTNVILPTCDQISTFHIPIVFDNVPIYFYSVCGRHRNAILETFPDLTKMGMMGKDSFKVNCGMPSSSSSKLSMNGFVSIIDPTYACEYEVLGDNFDIMINPTVMTQDHQRQSLHWFLLIAKKKSVCFPNLPGGGPKCDILQMDTVSWIPSEAETVSFEKDLDFHTVHTISKYLAFLQPYSHNLPAYIRHPYLSSVSKPSVIINSELIDASENSSEGMITINNKLHKDFVPKDINGEVAEKVVFGGDVLTNERAFSAQQHVINGRTSFTRTAGVIHRPEGLHRQMNLVLLIYQLLYKDSASQGTLYQLRNLVNRRNVRGPEDVINSFRSHQKFLDDVLEGFIVAAALRHFGMNNVKDMPSQNALPPIFAAYTAEGRYEWLCCHARVIRNSLTLLESPTIGEAIGNLDQQVQTLETTKGADNEYHCTECPKKYKMVSGLKKHLRLKHGQSMAEDATVTHDRESHPVIPTLIKLLYLQLDTTDAFRLGDGDRAMRNAKFEFLYLYARKHTKYRLWVWRMLAYDMAILSPRQAMEYRWNISVNTNGGVGNCIPNDNFVEVQVKNIKKNMARQGPNKSFATAQVACKTTQVVTDVKKGLQTACGRHAKGGRHADRDVTKDVIDIATSVRRAGLVDNPGQTLDNFENFQEPLSKIKPFELRNWIRAQQQTAAEYMI